MVPRPRTDAAAVRIPRRRFTTDEYHRMGEAGVLSEHDRVELLDWLVDLQAEVVEVYTRPALRGYRAMQSLPRGRMLTPRAFPRMRFRVSELLG